MDETPAYGATSAPLKPPTQMRSSSRISLALTRTLVSHSRTCTCAHTPELTLTRAQSPLAHGHARELMLEYTRVCVRGGHTGREQRDQPPGALDRPPSQLLPLWRRCLLACPHRPPRTRPRAVPRLWYREPWPRPRCVQVCSSRCMAVPGFCSLGSQIRKPRTRGHEPAVPDPPSQRPGHFRRKGLTPWRGFQPDPGDLGRTEP